MRTDTTVFAAELPAVFQDLFRVAPWKLWDKRARDLQLRERQNPYLLEYFDDKYPLERTMFQAMSYRRATSRYPMVNGPLGAQYYPLYSFATTVARVYTRLSSRGQSRLRGCLKDGLTSDTGLTPVALEMAVAVHLWAAGYDVDCTDLEGCAQFDFLARKNGIELEIDCKTASGDIGRPIHRRRMLELFHRVQPAIHTCLERGGGTALCISIPGALHGREDYMKGIAGVVLEAAQHRRSAGVDGIAKVTMDEFKLDQGPFNHQRRPSRQDLEDFIRRYLKKSTSQAISVHRPGEAAVVVTIESERADKVVEGVYHALRDSAERQFSRGRPGLLAVRLTDLTQDQLTSLAKLRRNGLAAIANRLLTSERRQHLYGVAFVAPSQVLAAKEPTGGQTGVALQDQGSALLFRNSRHPSVGDARLDAFGLFSPTAT